MDLVHQLLVLLLHVVLGDVADGVEQRVDALGRIEILGLHSQIDGHWVVLLLEKMLDDLLMAHLLLFELIYALWSLLLLRRCAVDVGLGDLTLTVGILRYALLYEGVGAHFL